MRNMETVVNGLLSAVNELQSNVNKVVQFIQNFQQSVRLDSTGKEIRLLGLQQLLIKKGLITEAEMTEQTGSVLMEMQKQAEAEAAKATTSAIVPATPEQVAQVATETITPPQA